MRDEFLISQCIRWNEQFRKVICDLAGITYYADDPKYTLSEFHGDENLFLIATRLQCEPKDVFETLKLALAEMHGVSVPQPSIRVVERPHELGNEDLNLFLNDDVLEELAATLGCSSQWSAIFGSLINAEALMELLTASGIAHSDEGTAPSDLFLRMISRVSIKALEEYYGGPVDMWDIIDSLISDSAKSVFESTFKGSAKEAFAFFAAPRESSDAEKPRIFLKSKQLDSLAIAKMRELLKAIGSTYLKDAQETASELAKQTSVLGPHLRLRSAVEYFALRRYRSALLSALITETSLGSLVQRFECVSSPRYSKSYLLQPKTSNEGTPKISVLYKSPESEKWQSCLTLYFESMQHAKHVENHFPKGAEQLGSQGDTLHERILTYPIPAMVTPAEKVWLKWSGKDASIIHHFILAGHSLPDDYNLRQKLRQKGEPCRVAVARGRTHCSTPQEILNSVRARFEQSGTIPKVV